MGQEDFAGVGIAQW